MVAFRHFISSRRPLQELGIFQGHELVKKEALLVAENIALTLVWLQHYKTFMLI